MLDFNDDVEKVAKEISDEADNQFLAGVVMTLRQQIQDRLSADGDAN